MSLFDSEDESEAVVWNPENSDDDEDDIIIDPSLGFSKDELATCLKVLSSFGSQIEKLQARVFKELRVALRPIVSAESGRNFQGYTWEEYADARARKKDDRCRRRRQAEHDKQLINSRKLRNERLGALKQLQERARSLEGVSLPQIVGVPDGPASASEAQAAITMPEETVVLQHSLRACYICKERFDTLHHFYDQLCPACAALNWEKRHQTRDLAGRYAIVTGGRVKIGYQISVKLLRAGCHVVVTTRFPADSLRRFEKESDFSEWGARLKLFGLDLRDLAATEQFCAWFKELHPWLDILINNACQTIRRPVHYYKHLIDQELAVKSNITPQIVAGTGHYSLLMDAESKTIASPSCVSTELEARSGPSSVASLPLSALAAVSSQVPMTLEDHEQGAAYFPEGLRDAHEQQLDLRKKNTWLLKLGEVSTPEIAEVMAVNALSPFILCGKLRSHFRLSPNEDRYIINVSAMEGKFYRFKTPHHPHTNMAKASLNMMTRTSGSDYAQDGIYMNAVDTGWINDENPLEKAAEIAQQHNFQTPIDEVDAAARVLDPVFVGGDAQQRHVGMFFKDYAETEW